jgi:hypothetical protein
VSSLWTPNCRHALGLLLRVLDWSLVVLNHCDSPGSVQPGPMGDPAFRGSCFCWFVRGNITAPNAPNRLCLQLVYNWSTIGCAGRRYYVTTSNAPKGRLETLPCLGQVRNSSTPWFGGEGAASLRTPNCLRVCALGLLLRGLELGVLGSSASAKP